MRLIMMSLAAMAVTTACVGILFLYALVVPTRPAPDIAIVHVPDAAWHGGPVEDVVVTLAAESR